MNAVKTAVLLGLLSAILLVGGELLIGEQGLYLGLLIAIVMNGASYFFSEKLALMSSGAQPVTPQENPEIHARLYPVVQRLAQRMDLPMPKLWLIPEDSPNAFATGRNPSHSSVAVTYGLLQLMNERELEGVLAHELGHVKNRDILIGSVAATIAAAITMLGRLAFMFGGGRDDEDRHGSAIGGLVMMIVAPIAAMLIQMAISRTREYSADATAAQYTGSPDGLINALSKLESWSQRIPLDASPAMSHMYIIKPFTGGGLTRMFSTHPSTEQRIERLQALRG